MLRRNVGGIDRVVRVVLGLFLLAMGFYRLAHHQSYAWLAAIVGLFALASGITGSCGLYVPFGISTARPGSTLARMMERCGCNPDSREMASPCCGDNKPAPPARV